jgi:glycosyltransferase involved in cell wall biosynthesis
MEVTRAIPTAPSAQTAPVQHRLGGTHPPSVAILVPCLNEASTVGRVVGAFRRVLPDAVVYVFDNNSTDATADVARAHGAQVVLSSRRGKGNVVRHMFEVVEADVFVMVDGDDTYPAEVAPELIRSLQTTGADMVVGTRMQSHASGAFRLFHTSGNRLLAWLISHLFRIRVTDILSGYRVFSRDFVKTVPLISEGFEVETELTLQAAAKGFAIVERPIDYGARPPGSVSKLNTFADGVLILRSLAKIFKDYKPQVFFTTLAALFAVCSLLAGVPPILDYYRARYVWHVPLAVLAAALAVLSMLSLGIGLVLDTVNRYHVEAFALWRRHLKQR